MRIKDAEKLSLADRMRITPAQILNMAIVECWDDREYGPMIILTVTWPLCWLLACVVKCHYVRRLKKEMAI